MSNLHCPNCDHLIGRLDSGVEPDELVVEWLREHRWSGPEPSGHLYADFNDWLTRNGNGAVISQKAWGQSMARAGLRNGRGGKGVRVWTR